MDQRVTKQRKNIYVLSFKWLQEPKIRKELLIFKPEADIETRKRPFCIREDSFEKHSWKILQNYDRCGFPPMERLELLKSQGHEVYGCGAKFRLSASEERTADGIKQMGIIEYWEHVHTEMYRSDDVEIEVKLKNLPFLALPYDITVRDDEGKASYKVRLWDAETKYEVDVERLPKEYWREAMDYLVMPELMMDELLPPQGMGGGKRSCLTQKYFMISASVQWAIKNHMDQYHTIENFHEKNTFLLCDAWCELAIPEFVRILQKEHGVTAIDALKIAEQACVYEMEDDSRNLFEVWSQEVISDVLPDIYQILAETGGNA